MISLFLTSFIFISYNSASIDNCPLYAQFKPTAPLFAIVIEPISSHILVGPTKVVCVEPVALASLPAT